MKHKVLAIIASVFAFAAACGGAEANLIPNGDPATAEKTPFGAPYIVKDDAGVPDTCFAFNNIKRRNI